MDSKIIKSHQCYPERSHCLMLYRLILNSNHKALSFLDKKRSLGRHEKFQKHNNEDFFIQLLNAWLHLTNSNSPTPTSIE